MSRSARSIALLVSALAALVALAWLDVLPGGWTLRGWVDPHPARRAREQAEHSAERVALFAAENQEAPAGAVLFIGSSTIERFPLAERFPGVPCLNRGIGNESATELLARLDASLPAAAPAGAVLYAASIDFRRDGAAPDVLAARVREVIDALRRRYPDLPVALIGLLSERDAEPPFVARLTLANKALAELAGDAGAAFVPADRPPLTRPGGQLDPGYSADRLHLNSEGYQHLARWLVEEGGEVGGLLAGG